MTDEPAKLTIGEFIERCSSMFKELYEMLDQFDDETDPVGFADAIVSQCLVHYLDPAVAPDAWKRADVSRL